MQAMPAVSSPDDPEPDDVCDDVPSVVLGPVAPVVLPPVESVVSPPEDESLPAEIPVVSPPVPV